MLILLCHLFITVFIYKYVNSFNQVKNSNIIVLAPPAASPGWNLDGPTSGPVQWVHASNGQIPPNALPGGFDGTNEQLYVARAEHNGALIPGKLVPSHGVVYVAWGGVENPKENYEVSKFLFFFDLN